MARKHSPEELHFMSKEPKTTRSSESFWPHHVLLFISTNDYKLASYGKLGQKGPQEKRNSLGIARKSKGKKGIERERELINSAYHMQSIHTIQHKCIIEIMKNAPNAPFVLLLCFGTFHVPYNRKHPLSFACSPSVSSPSLLLSRTKHVQCLPIKARYSLPYSAHSVDCI